MSSRATLYRYKKIQQRNLDLGEILFIIIFKMSNLCIPAYALARYDASQSEIKEISYDEIQMEEVHDDEIMKTEKVLNSDDAEVDMEVSSDGDDESNMEDSMDVDEIELNGDMATFLTDEKG
jgi:hypothetical protein